MKRMKQYGAGLLACLLLLAALAVLWLGYLPARQRYETERAGLEHQNQILQARLQADRACAAVQPRLAEAAEAVAASRQTLYDRFPVAWKEEDQVLYMLHLEELLGREVRFDFAQPEPLLTLRDGAEVQGMTFTFAHDADYQAFKKMVAAVSADGDRIASVRSGSCGVKHRDGSRNDTLQVTVYLLKDRRAYEPPAVNGSE